MFSVITLSFHEKLQFNKKEPLDSRVKSQLLQTECDILLNFQSKAGIHHHISVILWRRDSWWPDRLKYKLRSRRVFKHTTYSLIKPITALRTTNPNTPLSLNALALSSLKPVKQLCSSEKAFFFPMGKKHVFLLCNEGITKYWDTQTANSK